MFDKAAGVLAAITRPFLRSRSGQRLRLRIVAVRAAALMTGLGLLYFAYLWFTLPDISDPRSFLASQSTVITDRNGIELYRLFQEEDRTYVDGDAITDHMKKAIISIEDERFYDRGCLDIRALIRVALRMGQAGGGSTLTRQLARNALDLKRDNIYNRKLKELILGCQLESSFNKDQLLVLYLNWIPFGQNAYGVEQAAQEYFGASASGLTLAQSAVLASLPQRPTYFSPYGVHRNTTLAGDLGQRIASGATVTLDDIPEEDISIGLIGSRFGTGSSSVYVGGRTDQVLNNMLEQGYIDREQHDQALADLQTIEFSPSREDIRAPHFVLWVRRQVEDMFAGTTEAGLLERGGLTVETTLDWELQQAAQNAVEFHREDIVNRFGAQNMALMSVHPDTREILAYVGNMDYGDTEHGGKIDMVQVPRQPGSSFKPLVYAAAFEQGYGPATVLYDIETKIGEDEPQNFDGLFTGPITVRQALGASRNIPAAKAFFLAGGEEKILQLAAGLGAETPFERRQELKQERGEFDYGWPLALGAAETPLMEMVHAYSSIADEGVHKPMFSIRRIIDKNGNILFEPQEEEGRQVLDERIAYQITSILSDQSARPDPYWQSQLTISGFQTAAKTGTSNKCLEYTNAGACRLRKPDNAWLVGYTPELVTGVWVGNADSSAMFDRAGGLNTASPIWKDYMTRAHRTIDVTQTAFPAPDDIVQPQVSLLSGQLPKPCTPIEKRRADIFLDEYAPTQQDPACALLEIDKVTGLLASEACPAEAREEGAFFVARSILPDRWPQWESAVQTWAAEQMELWEATDNHSGSLLPLPLAPTQECDPSLTPGRLQKPEVHIEFPRDGGIASYPAFIPDIDFEVGSSVREMRFLLDGRRVAVIEEPPFVDAIRVPNSVQKAGTHELEVILTDEYYNTASDTITFRFDEDRASPEVRLITPRQRTVLSVGSSVTMRADASDAEGGIKYVQFYLNDTLLSTKPHEPYRLDYTFREGPGTYELRAVAEDMAERTAEDSVQIILVEDIELPDQPVILSPEESTAIRMDDVIDVTVVLPVLDPQEVSEIAVVVRGANGEEDQILKLNEGQGMYTRTWKGRQRGEYVIELQTTDRRGETQVHDRRIVEVR